MPSEHITLKCDVCLKCLREGAEARRLGSAVITYWTRVGPYVVTLCGDCAEDAINLDFQDVAAIGEKPDA